MSLLSEAVEKYHIPPWPYQAAFDRVVVFSVPEESATRDTYIEGGRIAKPESRRSYDQEVTPRGIVVSAGLRALDTLRSHGMDLGHMVWVARLSPWRHQVDRDQNGKVIEFLFLREGDIVGSETLLAEMKAGTMNVVQAKHVWERSDPPSYVA